MANRERQFNAIASEKNRGLSARGMRWTVGRFGQSVTLHLDFITKQMFDNNMTNFAPTGFVPFAGVGQ